MAQSPGPDAQAPTTTAAVVPGEFRAARVEVVGFDEAAVLAALRLRLPRLDIGRHGEPPPDTAAYAYLQISRGSDDTGALRVITADGRAYRRGFTVEVGQEVRIAASTAVNLLFSIEQGAVAPDREDVAIPTVAPESVSAATPVPIVVTPPPRPTAPRVDPPPPPRPGWQLAAALHGAAVLGLGAPQHGGSLAGGGGGVGLELRGPRGAALALEVRGLGRVHTELGVGRLRIAVAGGYAWRRGRFELPALVGLTVEPWWATQAGQTAPIYSGAAATSRRPLLGGLVRVTPSLRVAVARGSLAAVRVGPRIELAGSFVVDDGVKVVGLVDTTGATNQRLGGLELSLGLEVALLFGRVRR